VICRLSVVGCRPFVAFRSAKGFPVMNTTFRGAKGDYVLELTNAAEKRSQRTKAGIYFVLALKY
jgi:hypothetical protein